MKLNLKICAQRLVNFFNGKLSGAIPDSGNKTW